MQEYSRSETLNKRTEEVFFSPGNVVVLRQDVPNKPVMIVKSIDKSSEAHSKPKLLGITCVWFNTMSELQTARFSTKDLELYGNYENGE